MSRAFDHLVSTWTFCEDEDRDAFIAYLRICGYAITRQIRGYGPDLPDETATEKQAACMSRSEEFEKPAGPSRPVTAAGADILLPSVPAPNSQSDAPLGVSSGPDGRPADKSPVAHFPLES